MASFTTAAAPRTSPAHTRGSRRLQQCRAGVEGRPATSLPVQKKSQQLGYDIVLSSGFLAFAAHSGFLQAVEEVGLPVGGVMGTSAGALVGSLWSAGYSPKEIATEFTRMAPIQYLNPVAPWTGGILSLDPVIAGLRALVPERFEDLQREFGVGVVNSDGQHRLLCCGPLAEAVAASAAIPFIFSPVAVPGSAGGPFIDGGMKCRIGLDLWRQQRYGISPTRAASSSDSSKIASSSSVQQQPGGLPPPAVVHLIQRSSPFSGNDNTANLAAVNATVVRSPKSGKNFWQYEREVFERQFRLSRDIALPALEALMRSDQQRVAAAEDEQRRAANANANNIQARRRVGGVAPAPASPSGGRPSLAVAAKALPPAASARGE